MADIKQYNLKGVGSTVELGKQGSYITGTANSIGFYANGGALQKLEIADAVADTQAITKRQLDASIAGNLQHVTADFDFSTGTANLANIAAGTRIVTVTVDIPSAWTASSSATTFVEVGDGANGARFIRAQDVDVLKVAQYHSQFQYEYTANATLTLNVTPGDATAGIGTVSIVLASEADVLITDYGTVVEAQNSNPDLGNIN